VTENKSLETTSNARPWESETLPQGDAKRAAIREMFDTIAPQYDMVNRIMTFRLDTRWRRRAVRDLRLPPGSVVLDLASGTGDLCIDLAKANLRPISMDLSFGMLAADRSGSDGVTCGFALRNLTNLEEFFVELARVVRPGGRIALLDVGVPSNSLIRWGNSIYFGKMVPFIGGLLSDRGAYQYLPRSVAYLPSPSQMVAALQCAGFSNARHDELTGGLTQLLTGTRNPL